MIESLSIREGGSGRPRIEGPTWLVLAGCYCLWAFSLWVAPFVGVAIVVPLSIAIALHSSLQHEVLHGHPTRNAVVNEALVFLPVGLLIPYRRFRDLHLKHHNDQRLTDPYDDPESFYLVGCDADERCNFTHVLLAINGTFAGRMVIGPAMSMFAFYSTEIASVRVGNRRVIDAWGRHLLGLVVLIAVLAWVGIDPLLYFISAYVGMSLIMVRSFIEHRAVEDPAQRTAIVDANWFWRLLFLNNNYHLLHHQHPTQPWYRLPTLRRDAADAEAQNDGYVLPGYGHVAWRWLLRRREPYVHPLRTEPATPTLKE